MDIPKLRKLLSLDENDPLSRFALGKKLFEEGGSDEALNEAAEHLRFANARTPEHLATYHILAQVLIRLGHKEEARKVLEAGIGRVEAAGHGMGRDLGPAMTQILQTL